MGEYKCAFLPRRILKPDPAKVYGGLFQTTHFRSNLSLDELRGDVNL